MPTFQSIPNLTLPEFVLGGAERRGPHRALIDASTASELTYYELAAAVRAVAGGLFDRDVRQDDVLALCAPNSIEFVLAWYAASSIGAVVTALNPASTAAELTPPAPPGRGALAGHDRRALRGQAPRCRGACPRRARRS